MGDCDPRGGRATARVWFGRAAQGSRQEPFTFFDDLLDAKVREFNPRYAEAEGALLGQFRHLHTDIYGNREFVEHLRNWVKFFDHRTNPCHRRSKHTHEAFRTTSHEQHIDRS